MKLTAHIEEKKREAENITKVIHGRKEIVISNNFLLDFFDIQKCKEFDDRSKNDQFIARKVRDCVNQIRNAGKIHSEHYTTALQTYNEILIYDELRTRVNVIGRTSKGPDFILSKDDKFNVNADLKTIAFTNAKDNFIDYQNQKGLSELELLDAKKGIFPIGNKFSSIVTSPFRKTEGDIPEERKVIIERFIDKVSNQNDHNQLRFEGRNGIQIIDTLILGFPYFPQDGLREYIHPPISEYLHWAKFSGFLWYTCFGRPGDWVTDFKGPKQLSKYGILTNSEQYQQAVIFIIRLGGGRSGQPILCGFYNSQKVLPDIHTCLIQICDFANDESNSNPLSVSSNILDNYRTRHSI